MARFIEFIGVSGVGKSTTYQVLRKSSRPNSSWVTFHDLPKKTGNEKLSSLEFSLGAIFRPETLPRLAFDWERLENFFNTCPALLERFWQSFSKNESIHGKDLRFQVIQYILGIMEKMQIIKEEGSGKLCIVDEGLIHNLNYFTITAEEFEYKLELRKVLDLIYLPAAVVYFTGNADMIVSRTLERGNLKPRDKDLTLSELREARHQALKEKQIVVDILEEKNIPVLYLSSSDSVKHNSRKIRAYIEEIGKPDEVREVYSPKVIDG